MDNSPRIVSIHILDDDSLLHVFYHYRPFLLGEDKKVQVRLWGGNVRWDGGRWWYKLAHVCKRWRNILLGSASYLELCLVCTYGTPVADMLEHSPRLPLVIEYRYLDMTAEDEEGAILALKHRDRVRRIRFQVPAASLQKLIVAMDEEYPILEYLIVLPQVDDNSSVPIFPETLQAPRLRQLTLRGFSLPIGSRLLTSAVSLITLSLLMVNPSVPSTYFHPSTLLQWISFMPQLETLSIYFKLSIPDHDVQSQFTHTPIVAPVTLPNLRHFQFRGDRSYLEAFVHPISSLPRLEKLVINFFEKLTLSIPPVLRSIKPSHNLTFDTAEFIFFDKKVGGAVYPRAVEKYNLSIIVYCRQLGRQLSSMTQISESLSPMLSAVELLTFEHEEHSQLSEEHNEADRIEWRNLLRPFGNVKTLRIDNGLVKNLSRCLASDDGELSSELLPELREIIYSGSRDNGKAFTSFLDARENAGRHIILVRRDFVARANNALRSHPLKLS